MNPKRKDTFIVVRIDKETKKKLIDLAGGARKLSKYIRVILEKKIG